MFTTWRTNAKPLSYEELKALMKKRNEPTPFFTWTYYHDGRVETNCPPSKEPYQPPAEHKKFDYDKLIAESTGLYREWWVMWKRTHPEWALHPEEPKEPVIKSAPKPKPTFKPLTCKRCNRNWTPRSKEPPVQCPKCHSPYWNRERAKR